jgi:hypothetical protein
MQGRHPVKGKLDDIGENDYNAWYNKVALSVVIASLYILDFKFRILDQRYRFALFIYKTGRTL